MDEQALIELEYSLARFCDEVLSDVTLPTPEGLLRRVHWLYRGREFRASLLVPSASTALRARGRYVPRLPGHFYLDDLPSRPVFEKRSDQGSWDSALTVGIWHWMLRTAGRGTRGDGDELPGDPAGRPVRPRPGLPSLSASAAAIPDPVEYESQHYRSLKT